MEVLINCWSLLYMKSNAIERVHFRVLYLAKTQLF